MKRMNTVWCGSSLPIEAILHTEMAYHFDEEGGQGGWIADVRLAITINTVTE
jgi:hypothetical protein